MIYLLCYLLCGFIVASLCEVDVITETGETTTHFVTSLVVYSTVVLLFPLYLLFMLYLELSEEQDV